MSTVIYKMSRKDLINNDKFIRDNCWAITLLYNEPLDKSIKIDGLFGSAVIGNDLYYLVSDDDYVMMDGEEISPEDLLEDYYPSALKQFIVEDVPQEIYDQITDSDITFGNVNIEEMAINLLSSGNSLEEVFNDARDIGILD